MISSVRRLVVVLLASFASAQSKNASVPSERLSNGYEMPWVGLGTWMAKPDVVGEAVETALKIGYRHVDCAYAYQNQKAIGEAFNKIFEKDKSIKREDVFVTTKIWNTFHSYEKAKEAIDINLSELQLKYIDLMLIHWPMGYKEGADMSPLENGKRLFSNADYLDTWNAMEEAVEAGKIRSIGLSNFNHKQIERVIKAAKIKPVMLQVECHPYFPEKKYRAWAKERRLGVTAYSPLVNPGHPLRKKTDPNVLEESVIKEIAKKHGKTPAQVVLRWNVQQGVHVIPKSTNPEHIKENFDLFSFTLTEEDMQKIDGLDRNWRMFREMFSTDVSSPYYPFHEEY